MASADLGEAAIAVGKACGVVAGAIGAWLGIQKWREARREKMKAFFDSLATKDQVERHKKANDEQVALLRQELDRRLSAQDKKLEGIDEAIRDMPLRIVEVLKK